MAFSSIFQCKNNKGTLAFYILILFVYVILIGKAFCPSIQRLFMAQYHLRYDNSKDFPRWAALQFIPSMYNFSNELWYSDQRIEEMSKLSGPGVHHRWINHYPLRFVSFGLYRELFFAGAREHFIYLRSCYRGECLMTNYRIIPEGVQMLLTRF